MTKGPGEFSAGALRNPSAQRRRGSNINYIEMARSLPELTAHARIKCTIWRDDEFRTLSVDAQWTYQRLLSDSNRNQAGVLALTRKRWAGSAAGMTMDRLAAALDELVAATFVVLDEDTEEVLVRTYMRHNDIAGQPNILKAALRQAAQVESPLLRSALAYELRLLPAKPEDTARMTYPDPHAVAEAIDPGDLERRLSVVRSAPAQRDVSAGGDRSGKGSANPSENPSRNPREQEQEQEVVSRGGAGGELIKRAPIQLPLTAEVAHPEPIRPDAEALCARLYEKLIETDYKPLPVITKQWRTQARLLLDKDERNFDQALRLIDWSLANDFWSTNIASMGKFRTQYPKLLAAARREQASQQGRGRSVRDERVAGAIELGRRMAAEQQRTVWSDRRAIEG